MSEAEQLELPGVEPVPKKRGRGPGKKPAMISTSIRLSREVMDFFNTHYPYDKQAQMRNILLEYVRDEMKRINKQKQQELSNG